MKTVEFDVPGSASHQRREMVKSVSEIAMKIYGVGIDLEGLDLQQYYRPDGAKITKSLASLLRQKLDKTKVQEKFAQFAKEVAELYTTGLSLRAEFGDKALVGEGVYESAKTCFRKGAENEMSKSFIEENHRCAVMVLYKKGEKIAGGRCLVYFAGNRNIYLTNFYWRSITQNKLYFITALRHLLGIKKVLYRQNPKFFLPIFKNGDSILVYDERTRPIIPNKKLSCPHCGKSVLENELYSEEISSYRIVGCTQECARKHSRMYRQCDGCGDFANVNHVSTIKDKVYCQKCVRSMIVNCLICGNQVYKDEAKDFGGGFVCKACTKRAKCAVCGEIIRDIDLSKKIGDHQCCNKCLTKSGYACSICRTISVKKLPVKKIQGMKVYMCEDCSSPLPGTILEARSPRAEAR